jgi:hypothetical protein
VQLPAFLASAVASWADYYDRHHAVSVTVRYLHLVGLVVGGGTALAADRQILAAARSGPEQRSAVVTSLHAAHGVVVPALALMVTTGILMTAADADTFLASRLYWSKLGLVTLLLLNGLGLLAAERAFSRGGTQSFTGLQLTSTASLLLWLAILFAGVWLTVAA